MQQEVWTNDITLNYLWKIGNIFPAKNDQFVESLQTSTQMKVKTK